MKTWKMSGEVTRHEKKDITKRVFEGIGDNKTERTVEEEVFILTVLGNDGQRCHFSQDAPFDMGVGDPVNVKTEHGIQRKLDDEEEPKKRGK
jgi:hypothetical protein